MIAVWHWLVKSSEDPAKLALTVKGFLGTVGSVILLLSPLMNIQISNEHVSRAVDLAVEILVSASGIVSTLAMIYGLVRKLVNTFKK